MFQLIDQTTVTLLHINVRTEKHGTSDIDAMDLDLALTGENRKLLALLHPKLCEALFFNAEREAGQQVAEGVADSLPNLRFTKLADSIAWDDEANGVDLTVIYGLGDDVSNIKFENGRASMKRFEVTEGGSVKLVFKFSICGYPDGALDKLRKKLKQELTVTMVRPEKLRQDAVIDGTKAGFQKDYPGFDFDAENGGAGEGDPDEFDGDDGEGNAPDGSPEAALAAAVAAEDRAEKSKRKLRGSKNNPFNGAETGATA